jgi:hypothetical protein
MAKARGFTNSIQKMEEKQKGSTPSGEYGADYNKLRNLVAQRYPGLIQLLPPQVTFYGGGERQFTHQRFAEIDTFCEQITQLLSSQNE